MAVGMPCKRLYAPAPHPPSQRRRCRGWVPGVSLASATCVTRVDREPKRQAGRGTVFSVLAQEISPGVRLQSPAEAPILQAPSEASVNGLAACGQRLLSRGDRSLWSTTDRPTAFPATSDGPRYKRAGPLVAGASQESCAAFAPILLRCLSKKEGFAPAGWGNCGDPRGRSSNKACRGRSGDTGKVNMKEYSNRLRLLPGKHA